MNYCSMTFKSVKATDHCFLLARFIMLYKVVLENDIFSVSDTGILLLPSD